MKFQIKSTAGNPVKEGDVFVRYTGNSEPFSRGSEMANEIIGQLGVDPKTGDVIPKVRFKTGLDVKQIPYYKWFSEDQKKEFKKFVDDNIKSLENVFGGKATLDSENQYFWKTPERNKLIINNETLNTIFDTKNPEHCLLYINIMGGAFIDLVAPTKEMAERADLGIQQYLAIESEFTDDIANDYVVKGNAYSSMTELANTESDALLFISWCLQNNTKGFGAYTRSSAKAELIKYSGEFIEGKLTKTTRNCPKEFVTYSNKWKEGGLVRDGLMIEAYLKAAEYYSYLNTNKENKYQLPSGVILGTNIQEAIDTIRKPTNTKELESLRNFVESKWKE